jgi:uncharacterized protein with HEPN domain
MQRDDSVYVRQMIDLARKAITKVAGKTRADFDGDEDLRYVLLHLVQIVGEAARRVSQEFQRRHLEIPWSDVIGMRHKIVHDYMDINERLLWEVVTTELPPLIERLSRLVPPDDQ